MGLASTGILLALLTGLCILSLSSTVKRKVAVTPTAATTPSPASYATSFVTDLAMSTSPRKVVKEVFALGRTPFKTFDPFLFNMYHYDTFPAGENGLGPNPKLLANRDIGMDFSYKDGWSMYHGSTVPGFPVHPHRGFETITITQEGIIDHSDSIKCTARYGDGDTQWMTAGKGIQHAEMFPLLKNDKPNPLNIFQVWLNLPKKNKMCDPYFGMMWAETTPFAKLPDEKVDGGEKIGASVRVVAGELNGVQPIAPPPNSWASQTDSDVAVWLLDISPNSLVTLPPAKGGATSTRAIYFVAGKELSVNNGEEKVPMRTGLRVASDVPLKLEALQERANVLVLQGRPINETVVQHGPFVMNSQEEIRQCFDDFRRTQFGGWPWASGDHWHARDVPRHAVHPDGHKEFPPNK